MFEEYLEPQMIGEGERTDELFLKKTLVFI